MEEYEKKRRMYAGMLIEEERYIEARQVLSEFDTNHDIKKVREINAARSVARGIRELLIRDGVTEVKLAKEIGISKDTVNNLKKGKINNPSFRTVIALANYFNVTTDYFNDKS